MKYGTEKYGYYDKYMATMGAFLAIAYWFADDSIPATIHGDDGGYVWRTSSSFHKVFASAGGYSIEVDTAADPDYDATGLGRIHRRSAPTELALSTPLSAGYKFGLHEGVGRVAAAIGAGWKESGSGEIRYLAECSLLTARVDEVEEAPDKVRFAVIYEGEELPGGSVIEHYELTRAGVTLDISLDQPEHEPMYIRIPLLATNGLDTTRIEQEDGRISVQLHGYRYSVTLPSGTKVQVAPARYGNRNGEYVLAEARIAGRTARLTFEISNNREELGIEAP